MKYSNDPRIMSSLNDAEGFIKSTKRLLKMARMVIERDFRSNRNTDDYSTGDILCDMARLFGQATTGMIEVVALAKHYEKEGVSDSGAEEDSKLHYCDIIWRHDEDEDDDEVPVMVMIAIPGRGYSVLKDSTAAHEYPELFPKRNTALDLTPIPGIENVYFTFVPHSKRTMDGKTYVLSPAMVLKIDEEAGEFVNPDAFDLYKAAVFFENHNSEIRMPDGRILPAFTWTEGGVRNDEL